MSTAAADAGQAPAVSLGRRLAAELLGTSFLLIAVVGSGIAGERMAAGNTALVLLAEALATGAALFAVIEWLGPLSGAHVNPLVTLALLARGDITAAAAAAYIPAQFLGAVTGVGAANAMFGTPVFSLSAQVRSGPAQALGEFVAAFGLIGAVWTCSRLRPQAVAGVVTAYVFGAFWFTPAGFANPALTVARILTGSVSGIRPGDVPGFLAGQLAGGAAAVVLFRWLVPGAAAGARSAHPGASAGRERQPGGAASQAGTQVPGDLSCPR
jgi:glycerol uptake facilitator-like aquaporin